MQKTSYILKPPTFQMNYGVLMMRLDHVPPHPPSVDRLPPCVKRGGPFPPIRKSKMKALIPGIIFVCDGWLLHKPYLAFGFYSNNTSIFQNKK